MGLPLRAQQVCDTATLPFAEAFNGNGTTAMQLPPCWFGTCNFDMGDPPRIVAAPDDATNNVLQLYPGSNAESHYAMAITPPLNSDSMGGLILRFRMRSHSTSAHLIVGLCTDTARYTRRLFGLDTLHVARSDTWQWVIVPLRHFSPQAKRVAFRVERALQSDQTTMLVDDVSIDFCNVNSAEVGFVGTTDLMLDYVIHGQGSVTVNYADQSVDGSNPPLHITGLTPQTTYTFSIGCSSGTPIEVQATTLPQTSLATAYSQAFDTLPTDWLFPTLAQPRVANGALAVTASASALPFAVLPRMTEGVPSDLKVAVKFSSTNNTRIAVGVAEYPFETLTFVPVDTIAATPQGGFAIGSLSAYAGNGRYIALRAVGVGTLSVDEVRVGRCLTDRLRVAAIGTNHATLTIDTLTLSAGGSLQCRIREANSEQWTLLSVANMPLTINNLQAGSDYVVELMPACGDRSLPSDQLTFRTLTHELELPLCTGFEGMTSLPEGWICQEGTASIASSGLHGQKSIQLATGSILSLPSTPQPTEGLMLEAWVKGSGTLMVALANSSGTELTTIATLEGNGTWQRLLINPMPQFTARRLTFKASGGSWQIDDFGLKSSTVLATSITGRSQDHMVLHWQASNNADSVDIEYKAVTNTTVDFAVGSGTRLRVGANRLFDTIRNLTPSTTYCFHLWPSSEAPTCSYLTTYGQTLDPPQAIPLCENFASVGNGAFPSGWMRHSDVGNYPMVSSSRNHSGGKSLMFAATSSNHTIALLPDVNIDQCSAKLYFWSLVTQNVNGAHLLIGTMTDVDSPNTFVPHDTIDLGTANVWQRNIVSLPHDSVHWAMKLEGGSTAETHLFIDDLCIQSCVVQSISISTPDERSAMIGWTSDEAVAIEFSYRKNNQPQCDTFFTQPGIISGLDNGTQYVFNIRAFCPCGKKAGIMRRYSGTSVLDTFEVLAINTHEQRISLPYCSDFESTTTGYAPAHWNARDGTISVSDANYYRGGHSMAVSTGSTVVLPRTENRGEMTIAMQVYAPLSMAAETAYLVFGTIDHPDSAASFVATDTVVLSSAGQWQRIVSRIDSLRYGQYVAMKVARTSPTATLYVDDVEMSRCTIDSVRTNHDYGIAWNNVGQMASVRVEYGVAGLTQGGGTVDNINGTYFELPSNVDPTLHYEAYLTPQCLDVVSCMPLSVQFESETALPLCEDFDALPLAGMPYDWRICQSSESTPSLTANGSNKVLRMVGSSAAASIIALPVLALGNDSMQMSFSVKTGLPTITRIMVGEIANVDNANTFVAHDTVRLLGTTQWQKVALRTLGYTSTSGRIAIKCVSTGQRTEVQIDSVKLTKTFTPTVSIVSARSIELNVGLPIQDYFVEYHQTNSSQGSTNIVRITSDPYIIDGLLPQTPYSLHYRADSLGQSCTEPLSFTTPGEEDLSFCLPSLSFSTWICPELNISRIADAHLYADVTGNCSVEVGVMQRQGDWSSFLPIDTIIAPTGVIRPYHVPFQAYQGSGRFIALRSIGGANVTFRNIHICTCTLPQASLSDNNQLYIQGSGEIEYGARGFLRGSGTVVAFAHDTTLYLPYDTSLYDIYTLCPYDINECGQPTPIVTTYTETLPYCYSPKGWQITTNASNSIGGGITSEGFFLTATATQTTYIQSPVFTTPSMYVNFDWTSSATSTDLIVGTDTLHTSVTGQWQRARVRVDNAKRLRFELLNGGRVEVRNLYISECPLPRTLSISQPSDGATLVSWDTVGVANFYIGYRMHNQQAQQFSHVGRNDVPLRLMLQADTSYSLTSLCSTTDSDCRTDIVINTLSSVHLLPYCDTATYSLRSSIPSRWQTLTDSNAATRYYIIPRFDIDSMNKLNVTFEAQTTSGYATNVTLGVMSDATDADSFDSICAFYISNQTFQLCSKALSHYFGTGRLLALRINTTDAVEIRRFMVNTCSHNNMHIAEATPTSVRFEWEQQGSLTIDFEYGESGFIPGSGILRRVSGTTSVTIYNLVPLKNYTFFVRSSCTDACINYQITDTFHIFTPMGGSGCIDYTNLTAGYVTCQYGSYDNPSANTGRVDYGYTSPTSRHTVHNDTAERDARTDNRLRTVPMGHEASVRLGNWSSGGAGQAEAECITYSMTVDLDNADLLLLKYAAVLQDPEHSQRLQPRFRMEVLNQQGELIDACSKADFIANANLGWNIAANDVLWKDWTTVGLDLTPYAGQTILIRLTTNDCGEGSHFGYAYFTLECSQKSMSSEGCSHVASNRFSVPDGFNYRWYTNHSNTTISTEQSIYVPSDNSVTYYCDLSFIDQPTCKFTMSAFAGARFPLAIIDTVLTQGQCAFDLQLTNRSTISADGVTPIGTGERCETGMWILPNGDTSIANNISLHLSDTGLYTVTLMAGIANNQCIDTLTLPLHIGFAHPNIILTGDTVQCNNHPIVPPTILHAQTIANYLTDTIRLATHTDIVYHYATVDTNGCIDTLHHSLTLYPAYLFVERDSLCITARDYSWRDTVVHFAASDTSLQATRQHYTTHQCDSIYRLELDLHSMQPPQISVESHPDCNTLYHSIEATGNARFWRWTTSVVDSTLVGHESETYLAVKPVQTTTYRLDADYDTIARCPVSTSITLSPFSRPTATLRVRPLFIVPPDLRFSAIDQSQTYASRQWIIDGQPISDTNFSINGIASENNDSLRIALVVTNGTCYDTAWQAIPIHISDLFIPNAFTPVADDNKTFFVRGKNISHYEIDIFNRKGLLVYHSTDIDEHWDGKNTNGINCPMGTYVFRIRYSASFKPEQYQYRTGSVMLIR